MSKYLARLGTAPHKYQFGIVLHTVTFSKPVDGSLLVRWTRGPRAAKSLDAVGRNGYFAWGLDPPLMMMSTLYYSSATEEGSSKKRKKEKGEEEKVGYAPRKTNKRREARYLPKKSTIVVKRRTARGGTRTVGRVQLDLSAFVRANSVCSTPVTTFLDKCSDKRAILKFTVHSRYVKEVPEEEAAQEISQQGATSRSGGGEYSRQSSFSDADSVADFNDLPDKDLAVHEEEIRRPPPPSRNPFSQAALAVRKVGAGNVSRGGGGVASSADAPTTNENKTKDAVTVASQPDVKRPSPNPFDDRDGDDDDDSDKHVGISPFSDPAGDGKNPFAGKKPVSGVASSDGVGVNDGSGNPFDDPAPLHGDNADSHIQQSLATEEARVMAESNVNVLREQLLGRCMQLSDATRKVVVLSRDLQQSDTQVRTLKVENAKLRARHLAFDHVVEMIVGGEGSDAAKTSDHDKIRFYEHQLKEADGTLAAAREAWLLSSSIMMGELQSTEQSLKHCRLLLAEALDRRQATESVGSGKKGEASSEILAVRSKLKRALRERMHLSEMVNRLEIQSTQRNIELTTLRERVKQLEASQGATPSK